MVWACVSASGVGAFVKTNEIMSTTKNNQILIHRSIAYGKHLIGNSFVFRHEKDPKHTDDAVKSCSNRKTHNEASSIGHPRTQTLTLLMQCGVREFELC